VAQGRAGFQQVELTHVAVDAAGSGWHDDAIARQAAMGKKAPGLPYG
jgi:hypothetical protein